MPEASKRDCSFFTELQASSFTNKGEGKAPPLGFVTVFGVIWGNSRATKPKSGD